MNFLTVDKYAYDTGNLVIDSEDAAKVAFYNTDDLSIFLKSVTLAITNNTKNGTIDNFKKTGITSKPSATTNELVLPTSSITKISDITNYNSFIYQPAITIDGLTASGESGANVSRIESALTGVQNYLDETYTVNTQYYVTKGTDQPTDQTIIDPTEPTITAKDEHDAGQLSFTPSTLSDTTGVVNDLVAGTYTVHGRIQIVSSDGTNADELPAGTDSNPEQVEGSPGEKIQTRELTTLDTPSNPLESVGVMGDGTKTYPFIAKSRDNLSDISDLIANERTDASKNKIDYQGTINTGNVYISIASDIKYGYKIAPVKFRNFANKQIILNGIKDTNVSEADPSNHYEFYYENTAKPVIDPDEFNGFFRIEDTADNKNMNITF